MLFRYIDDVFVIWTHGPDEVVSFMTEFNNYHPNTKFNYEPNKKTITFLGLKVTLSGNKLTTGLHTKSKNKYQHLHYGYGSCKCYCKRCEVCDNVTETLTFTITETQDSYKINHQFNCSKKFLVYLLTCNKCFKVAHVVNIKLFSYNKIIIMI